jgi:signal transduction histidine kinase
VWTDDLDLLIDSLPLGVLALDSGGSILRANPAALDVLRLDESALGQGPVTDLIEDEGFRRALQGPANGSTRLTFRTGDRVLHAEVGALPGGAVGRRLVTLRDVTDVVGSNRLSKSLFLEILHRIRTPLTTILSSLSMGTSENLAAFQVDRLRILGMGRQEAERLTAFVGQLRELFLIEIDALREEGTVSKVDAGQIVARVAEGFRPRFEGKDQTIEVDVRDHDHRAMADPEFLARAVVQVLRNAHLHTPEGSTVNVEVEGNAEVVRIVISDDGPGIGEAELAEVLEKFHRGRTTAPGEGLGLYLARHLVLAQNGSLHLDSLPGHGVTVEIDLPAADDLD